MPSQHKHPNITIRPPEELRAWLLEHVRRTGRARNAILVDALARYRRQVEQDEKTTENGS